MKFYAILVGALTAKPYAFVTRSWELKSIETIDLFESLNSNIRIDLKGSDIIRILPSNNEAVNQEWISDKSRYAYDGLKRKRFINPFIKKNNFFVQTSWEEVFFEIKNVFKKRIFNNTIVETGNFLDLEQIPVLDKFVNCFSNIIINSTTSKYADFQNSYLTNFNDLFNSLFIKGPKALLIVGCNLRTESPVLNIRLQKLSQSKHYLVAYIGSSYNYTIDLYHISNNVETFKLFLNGKNNVLPFLKIFLKKNLSNFKIKNYLKNKISLLLGNEFISNNNNLFPALYPLITKYFNLNMLYLYNGDITLREFGLFNNKKPTILNNNFIYLLNVDSYPYNLDTSNFIIFQGQHNETIKDKFNIILPSCFWTEKSNLFLNCFGLIQKSKLVAYPLKLVRNDWRIIQMISFITQNSMDFNSYTSLLNKLNTFINKITLFIDKYQFNLQFSLNLKYTNWFQNKHIFSKIPFKTYTSTYYKLTSIEKASKIMNSCSADLLKKKNNFLK